MIDVKVAGQAVEISITGFDAWRMDVRRLSIRATLPLEHVTAVSADKAPGAAVRTSHTISRSTGRMVCAKRRGRVLQIDGDGRPWRTITLSVPDPEAAAAEIKDALQQSGR